MPAPPERFAIPWSTKKLTGLVVMSAMLVVVGVLMSVVVADAPTVVRDSASSVSRSSARAAPTPWRSSSIAPRR